MSTQKYLILSSHLILIELFSVRRCLRAIPGRRRSLLALRPFNRLIKPKYPLSIITMHGIRSSILSKYPVRLAAATPQTNNTIPWNPRLAQFDNILEALIYSQI